MLRGEASRSGWIMSAYHGEVRSRRKACLGLSGPRVPQDRITEFVSAVPVFLPLPNHLLKHILAGANARRRSCPNSPIGMLQSARIGRSCRAHGRAVSMNDRRAGAPSPSITQSIGYGSILTAPACQSGRSPRALRSDARVTGLERQTVMAPSIKLWT